MDSKLIQSKKDEDQTFMLERLRSAAMHGDVRTVWALAKEAKALGLSVGVVIAFVVIALVLAIGIYVVAYFQVSLNTSGLKNTATNAIGAVFNTAYTGFQLLVVGLIVLAAVAILSILTGGFGVGGRGSPGGV